MLCLLRRCTGLELQMHKENINLTMVRKSLSKLLPIEINQSKISDSNAKREPILDDSVQARFSKVLKSFCTQEAVAKSQTSNWTLDNDYRAALFTYS